MQERPKASLQAKSDYKLQRKRSSKDLPSLLDCLFAMILKYGQEKQSEKDSIGTLKGKVMWDS